MNLNRIVERITRDIYGKIAALAIAIVLYLYLGAIATGVARKELVVVRKELADSVREENHIEIEEPTDIMVLIERGKIVEATIEGPQSKIDQLSLRPLVGRVHAEFFRPWIKEPGQPRVTVNIPSDKIEILPPWAGNLVRLREPSIPVVLVAKERRFVTVEPVLVGKPAAGNRVRSSFATPSRVEVEGPEEELRSGKVRLAPVSVQDQSSSFTIHGHLHDSLQQRYVKLLEDVTVVVQIEPTAGRVERELPLSLLMPPVVAGEAASTGAGADGDRFEQKGGGTSIHVTFEGPPEALEHIGPTTVRAFVDLTGWGTEHTEEASLPLQVLGVPEGCTFLPQRIAIRRIQGRSVPKPRSEAPSDGSKGGGR
ncbi:MAG: hypothetical protein HYR85_01515 [Planctomycetes bacterium]|nr:hypothetical protein [Planctomycetota bacterium]MBI3843094.1 hypothetical protein [Planctomycetota bacterium]